LEDKGHRQEYARREQNKINNGAVIGGTQHCALSVPICSGVNKLPPQIEASDFGESAGWFSLSIRATCMKTIGEMRKQHLLYSDGAAATVQHSMAGKSPSKHF